MASVDAPGAARAVLLAYMRYQSDELWAAVWRVDLEYALAGWGDESDQGAFRWLVGEAGGWWSWGEDWAEPVFVEGSYAELQRRAVAGGWSRAGRSEASGLARPVRRPARGAGPVEAVEDVSWEAMGRRLWGIRYKAVVFAGIVVFADALRVLFGLSENDQLWVTAPLAVLLLIPNPPLWRIPLRSRKSR